MIYGLAAVVGQASKAPPLSSYVTAAQELHKHLSAPPPSQYPHSFLNLYLYTEICARLWYRTHVEDLSLMYKVSAIYMLRCEKALIVITFYFYKTDHFVSQKLVFFHRSLVQNSKVC